MTRLLAVAIIVGLVLLYAQSLSPSFRAWLRGLRGRSSRAAERQAAPRQRRVGSVERAARAEADRFEAYSREVAAMSVEQARLRAEPILTDPDLWRRAGAPLDGGSRLRDLPTSLASLFAESAQVNALHGAFLLDGDRIEPIAVGPDLLTFGSDAPSRDRVLLRVGEDVDGDPAVVEPGRDTIYIVHPGTSTRPGWIASHPSIYHWLLIRHYGIRGKARRAS